MRVFADSGYGHRFLPGAVRRCGAGVDFSIRVRAYEVDILADFIRLQSLHMTSNCRWLLHNGILLGMQGRCEQGEDSRRPHQRVTSQMLINKYQHRWEKEQHRQDERARREEKHWGCPFFTDCWNAGLRVPSVDDCPECNKIHGNQFSYKRQCVDGRSQ